MPFRVSRRVEFSDTDMAGIVHFANFFRFMEAAEHAYLRACGLSVVSQWQGQAITFPRVHADCDYLKPARFEEVLDIEVAIARIGRTSVHYTFTFFRQTEILARGNFATVLCRVRDDHALESMEIPDALRERLLAGASS